MTGRPLILTVVSRPLYLLILLASLWVLLRGHNEPGGGFIGGLIAVSATILWAVAHGSEAARARLPLGDPLQPAVIGLLCAGLSGVPGWLAGQAPVGHAGPWPDQPAAIDRAAVRRGRVSRGVGRAGWLRPGPAGGGRIRRRSAPMIWAVAFAIWVSLAAGIYLCLSRDVFRIALGLAVLGAGVNLALLASGRFGSMAPAVVPMGETLLVEASNPLPQALVLTAIVIGFALVCWSFVLVLGLIRHGNTDDAETLREAEPATGADVKPPLPEPDHEPAWPPETQA